MSPKTNHYDTLGVKKTATDDEIKKAFRKLARKHHPDAGGSEDKFKSINEAYEILSDKDKRKQYDQYGQYFGEQGPPPGYGQSPGGGSPYGGYSTGGGGGYQQVDFGDMGDLFGSMFGGSGGGFSGFGGRGRSAVRGQDLELNTTITFEQAFAGTTLSVQTGSGREMSVNVPAGATDGGKLRFRGKGEPGANGGPAGDLYVITKIAPHRIFKREGADVVLELPLTISEAALGATVSVPLPGGGKAKLKIPAGTQEEKIFRMKDKGAPKLKGGGHGSLKVKAKIIIPTALTPRQKELLQEFDTASKPEGDGESLRKHLA